MPRLRAWFSRLLGLFRKNRRNAEMAEEIQQHVDLLTERNIAAGMSPIEARHAALRQFGGIEQTKEIAREQRVWRWADEFVQDVRFGTRMLWRSPGIFHSCHSLSDTRHRHQRGRLWLDRRNSGSAISGRGSSGTNVCSCRNDPRLRRLQWTVVSRFSRSSKKLHASSNRSSSIASWEQRSRWAIARNLPAAES